MMKPHTKGPVPGILYTRDKTFTMLGEVGMANKLSKTTQQVCG